MLAVLLLGTLFLSSTAGLPGPDFNQFLQAPAASTSRILATRMMASASEPLSSPQCVCPNTRSVFNILWSCLSTIFLCTWVTAHPNMSPKGASAVQKFMHRLKLMFTALIGPETVLVFSMRQWMSARRIHKKYRNRGWTMTHGFFLIMGGFVLKRGDDDLGVLDHALLQKLDEAGEIHFPTMERGEIEDKSKGDVLSMVLVILQTLWFVIQCIARGVRGLALTELEVVTLAFCSLNAAMYAMWWYKPLNVNYPIPVYLKAESNYIHERGLKRAKEIDDVALASRQIEQALKQVDNGGEDASPDSVEIRGNVDLKLQSRILRTTYRVRHYCCTLILRVGASFDECVFCVKNKWCKDLAMVDYVTILVPFWIAKGIFCISLMPFLLTYAVCRVLLDAMFESDRALAPPGRNRVPSFYSPTLPKPDKIFILSLFGITGAIFGGLHLIPWRFRFPTKIEAILWRTMSSAITSLPLAFLFTYYLRNSPWIVYIIDDEERGLGEGTTAAAGGSTRIVAKRTIRNILVGTSYMTTLYIPARLYLLIESFVLLRELPPSALLDIDWEKFIPHF